MCLIYWYPRWVDVNNKRIQELEEKIADLKKRWPAHSVPPAILRELDDLEGELMEALGQVQADSKAVNSCHTTQDTHPLVG